MQCDEFDINKAKGLRLFEEIRSNGVTIPTGKKLEDKDIELLKKHNIRKVFCAEEEMNDVSFQIALRQLCAQICGEATAYSIGALEDRGSMFIAPGEEIYEGMIVGEANKDLDLAVNVVKAKQQTNTPKDEVSTFGEISD